MEETYLSCGIIGAVAGLRSMTAPAIVSNAAAFGDLHLNETPFKAMESPNCATVLMVCALGEIIADKTSWIPNRTEPPSLIFRITSGAVCGAAICTAKKQPAIVGALIGGMAALGTTFLAFQLRRKAVNEVGLPDFPVALLEDGIAVSSALSAMSLAQKTSVEYDQ